MKPSSTQELLARRSEVLGASYRLFYEEPIHLVRGVGVEVFDSQGTRFLDAYNNVPIVGHCNARVIKAQCDQASVLNSHTRYLSEGVIRYAEKLIATMDSHLTQVMFTCTGSEAIDLALRMVRLPGQAQGIVITENAYHGVTAAASAVSPSLGSGYVQEPWIRRVAVPRRVPRGQVAEFFAEGVRLAIADLQDSEYGFSALLMDMAFVSDGVFLQPPGFIAAACQLAHDSGGLVIADEVQSGFGRTGAVMWGYHYHGIRPDLVIMGKSMANGLPVGGVVGTPEIMDRFANRGRYFNTYGGNQVCMAAAEAVLDVIQDDCLLKHAERVGSHLQEQLSHVCAPFGSRVVVSGAGLLAGLEFRDEMDELDPKMSASILNGFRRSGVLVGQCGPANSSIKIRPPLPFTETNVDELSGALSALLGQLPL